MFQCLVCATKAVCWSAFTFSWNCHSSCRCAARPIGLLIVARLLSALIVNDYTWPDGKHTVVVPCWCHAGWEVTDTVSWCASLVLYVRNAAEEFASIRVPWRGTLGVLQTFPLNIEFCFHFVFQTSSRHWQLPQAHPHTTSSYHLKGHSYLRLHLPFDC